MERARRSQITITYCINNNYEEIVSLRVRKKSAKVGKNDAVQNRIQAITGK
jgi:hypothetical protein